MQNLMKNITRIGLAVSFSTSFIFGAHSVQRSDLKKQNSIGDLIIISSLIGISSGVMACSGATFFTLLRKNLNMQIVAASLAAGVVLLPQILTFSLFGSALGAFLGGGFWIIMDKYKANPQAQAE